MYIIVPQPIDEKDLFFNIMSFLLNVIDLLVNNNHIIYTFMKFDQSIYHNYDKKIE